VRELISVFSPLLFTISIEWILFFFISREKILKTIGFVILMNMISWPIATLLYWNWPNEIYWIELLVVLIETFLIGIYWKYKWLKSASLSLIMNSASYFIGILIFQ
jgi:glucose-6-phosphate-specific signal transduction histidine kinase